MRTRHSLHHNTRTRKLDGNRQTRFAFDDQIKSGKRQAERIHIDRATAVRI
jgi:hypothetical protein